MAAMTVKQLRKALAAYPDDWKVATAAHDNTEDQIQGTINGVQELEPGRYRDDLGPTVVLSH